LKGFHRRSRGIGIGGFALAPLFSSCLRAADLPSARYVGDWRVTSRRWVSQILQPVTRYMIRVYDDVGNVIETPRTGGRFQRVVKIFITEVCFLITSRIKTNLK
jgi:hypothetical protein